MTVNEVLNYINIEFGVPYVPLELNSQQILQLIYTKTIPTFSKYLPRLAKMAIDFTNPAIQTQVSNEFLISDPLGLPIIDVAWLIPTMADPVISGHPIIGLLGGNWETLANYLLQTNVSNELQQFSMLNQTFEFVPPNLLRVIPTPNDQQTLIYETYHTRDFTSIPPEFADRFLDLAWADVAIAVARIRKYYTNIQTPMGEIQLNADELMNDAKELRASTIEFLQAANPSVIMEIY
ncbi:MAG: hypothetical protein QXP36_14765 [Conexivisphaerales archaeon]